MKPAVIVSLRLSALQFMFLMQGMAEAGNLSKLTVNDLKKYCEANQLPKSGKKDDVIERIKKHMGMES